MVLVNEWAAYGLTPGPNEGESQAAVQTEKRVREVGSTVTDAWMKQKDCRLDDQDLFVDPEELVTVMINGEPKLDSKGKEIWAYVPTESKADRAARQALAKAICKNCVVFRQCEQDVIQHPNESLVGVRAGRTPHEWKAVLGGARRRRVH